MKTVISFISIVFIGLFVQAQDAGLCNNLSRYSCSPGSVDDGTGRVRSTEEMEDMFGKIRAKYQTRIQERWKKEINKEENAYFRESAMAVLGLKNSPDCQKGSPNKASCDQSLIEGLSRATSYAALGSLRVNSPVSQLGNLKEMGILGGQAVFQEVRGDIERGIEKEIAQPELETKIREKIFPQIRDLIVKRLQDLPIPDKQREMMINKIKGIRFKGTQCAWDKSSVNNLLIPNAFYDPNSNAFTYCNGYLLQSSSEFHIANVIGHELGHAIDPCGITMGPEDYRFQYSKTADKSQMETEYPIPNLLSCLRSPNSINAQSGLAPFNAPGMMTPGGGYMTGMYEGQPYGNLMTGQGGGLMAGQAANPAGMPPARFCNHAGHAHGNPMSGSEQINESFADWIGMEVTTTYIENNFKLTEDQFRKGYSNIWRTNCSIMEKGPMTTTRQHPEVADRIDKMILVHPKARAQMNCPPRHPENIYCDPTNPLSVTAPSRKSKKPSAMPDLMPQPPPLPVPSPIDPTQSTPRGVK